LGKINGSWINAVQYYKTLGIKRNASQEEIKRAYRKLVRQYHPDHNHDAPTEKIQAINEAYATLINPHKRREYDLSTGVRVEPPPPRQPGANPPPGPVQGRSAQPVKSTPRPPVHDYGSFTDYPEDAGWGKLFYYLGLMALIGICQLGFLIVMTMEDDNVSTSRPLPTATDIVEETPTDVIEMTVFPE
jgi:hypothetical protein